MSEERWKVEDGATVRGGQRRDPDTVGMSIPHCPGAECKLCPGTPRGQLIPGPHRVGSQLSSSPGQEAAAGNPASTCVQLCSWAILLG